MKYWFVIVSACGNAITVSKGSVYKFERPADKTSTGHSEVGKITLITRCFTTEIEANAYYKGACDLAKHFNGEES
jgi:hypothetical protein